MLKVKISISSAYFSAVETMADFFNRIGQKRPFSGKVSIREKKIFGKHASVFSIKL